ncbi:MAG: M20/M25/M40 family metallo-hydrolase [Bdellovibrionota bacterium]|nr:M20/M25/M40 family metallo-hydrolase [Pseudomonadota bacterium]MDY6090627.1 M20/M25/M40 family metallo-hydrolase [Bdellovibrionota bacterium]
MTTLNKSSYLQILDKLIAIDTSVGLSTLEAVNFIIEYLKKYHVKFNIIKKFYNGVYDSNRATLLATLGDASKPGIILSGHLDTFDVNANKEKWNSNPLELVIKNDVAYGRGVVDMKGAIAVALSLVSCFQQKSSTIPIHFCFTHDEEGVLTAAYQLKENNLDKFIPLNQIGCMVMEATNLVPIISHRGNKRLEITILGKGCHASTPNKGCDALYYGVKLYNYIYKVYSNFSWKKDKRYDYDHAVLNIGKMSSGDGDNFVPNKCVLLISCRYLYGDDIDIFFSHIWKYIKKLEAEMKSVFNEAKIIINYKNGVLPLSTPTNSHFYQNISRLVNEFQEPMVDKNNFIQGGQVITYGTEAGHFQSLGIDTIVCGPGSYEAMSTSHKPNEKIELNQLQKFEDILTRVQTLSL